VEATKFLDFPNYRFNINYINKKIKILLFLSEAFTSYYLNVFILILSLSEGRAGIAWETSNNKTLFLLPETKRLWLLLHNFHFASTLLLSFPTLSLFGFKGLSVVTVRLAVH
jgi:hypothetical protein